MEKKKINDQLDKVTGGARMNKENLKPLFKGNEAAGMGGASQKDDDNISK